MLCNKNSKKTSPSVDIIEEERNFRKIKKKSLKRFENVRVYVLNCGVFRRGAAMTIPGIGIFVGPNDKNDISLLRHEFGHILQYRKWGAIVFWFKIAPASLRSVYKERKNKLHNHMESWCEWSANELSYQYFNSPADWEHNFYPILPSKKIT